MCPKCGKMTAVLTISDDSPVVCIECNYGVADEYIVTPDKDEVDTDGND